MPEQEPGIEKGRDRLVKEADKGPRAAPGQHQMLVELGKVIVSEINMDTLFEVIVNQTRGFMGTEGCSVFMFDKEKNQLWSRVSTDLKKDEIRFPSDQGIAGWVFQHQKPLLINDAYADPRFYQKVDRKTGFRTRNILCLPLINRYRECIGTLQIFNKRSGDFTDDDRELLDTVSHYVTIALENAKLYDDLKVLDKAKERVINHLSHELKTPLAIILATLVNIERQMEKTQNLAFQKTLKRGRRQVQRLMDLQAKIDDILSQRPLIEQRRILTIIENAADLVEEFKGQSPPEQAKILGFIADRIEALFKIDEIRPEWILLAPFLEGILQRARSAMGPRELEINAYLDNAVKIHMDRQVLEKVAAGLLKNAIESTPDEGRIALRAEKGEDGVQLSVQDHGVGITAVNRDLIFGGFFHTMDTELYSSKRPYEFNAGGAGADLLRIKVFSERFGFFVDFETRRCPHIPGDTDLCPGRISRCPFATDREICLTTGGSTFYVNFPVGTNPT
ncbi:MAG: GAF domain-containing sensor histidine kinase [Pseudomonadota bacterium]